MLLHGQSCGSVPGASAQYHMAKGHVAGATWTESAPGTHCCMVRARGQHPGLAPTTRRLAPGTRARGWRLLPCSWESAPGISARSKGCVAKATGQSPKPHGWSSRARAGAQHPPPHGWSQRSAPKPCGWSLLQHSQGLRSASRASTCCCAIRTGAQHPPPRAEPGTRAQRPTAGGHWLEPGISTHCPTAGAKGHESRILKPNYPKAED